MTDRITFNWKYLTDRATHYSVVTYMWTHQVVINIKWALLEAFEQKHWVPLQNCKCLSISAGSKKPWDWKDIWINDVSDIEVLGK